jgi:hypothetical protein
MGGSSTGVSTAGVIERRVPSAGELSPIRDLRDQLKKAQQEMKEITAHVAVSRSKASQAATTERYLLCEIDSIGKSLNHCFSLMTYNHFYFFFLVPLFFHKELTLCCGNFCLAVLMDVIFRKSPK